jgi:hypothetical protein
VKYHRRDRPSERTGRWLEPWCGEKPRNRKHESEEKSQATPIVVGSKGRLERAGSTSIQSTPLPNPRAGDWADISPSYSRMCESSSATAWYRDDTQG